MKRGIASKIIVLSILLTVMFSAVGVAPAQAAGPLSHNDVVRAARELLPASELKTILQDYQGAVLSGSVYPDWGIVYAALTGNSRYSDYTENSHSAEFATAYLNIVRGYSQPYDEYEKKSIAFLFGLIAHKTSDDAFHGGFLPVAYDADNGGVEDHGLIEFGVDSFNTVYSAGYNTDWFFPFLEVWAAYMELYDNGMYSYDPPSPTDLLLGFDAYVTESETQVAAAYPALVYYYFRLPNTRDLMRDPDVPGSMPNMAYLTKEKWLAAWNVFDYTGAYHVKPTASGTGDCRSWENACTLQTALNIPYGSNEVWVMGGEYKPTDGTDRAATFRLRYGLSVYGGFAGTEDSRDLRDPAANVTTLSGDIDPAGDNDSYHVVMGVTGSTLDGFTVTKGNANGASPNDIGGGMNNIGQPIVSNIIFTDNAATRGGGAYNKNWEWYNPDAAAVFTNVTFSNNSATWGGGVYNYLAQPTFTNITFSGNSASQNGGGMANEESSPILTNVTFSGNQADGSGGGMRNDSNSNPQIINSIFWSNTAVTSDPQISNVSSVPVVSYSVIEGITDTSNGNTGNDPKLGSLGNHDGFTPTIPLQEGSSAIDAGDDASCPETDQRGVTRPQRGHCDIGAFELGVPAVSLSAASHDFGDQELGTTSGAFTVTLTNTGNADLHIDPLTFTSDWIITNDTCSSATVIPAGTCTFDVAFHPLALGPLTGSVTISSNATSSPDHVALSGNGIAPAVGLSAASLTFGNQLFGTTSAAQTVTLTNTGTADLHLDQLTFTSDWILSNDTCSNATIIPSGTCAFDTAFHPLALGPLTGSVTIHSNAASSPDQIALSGNGIAPAVSLSAVSLTFGGQPVSTTSDPQTVTLTNSGTADLHIGTLTITGNFSLTNNTCNGATVAPSGACTFDVTFTPLSSRAKTGRITVPSDAASSPDTVTLSGNGVTTMQFRSNRANDGTLRESSELSGLSNLAQPVGQMLLIGDDALKRQYLGILDFDTSSLPDNAVITGVKLQVKVMFLSNGVYAGLGDLLADVTNPYFGGLPGLQNSDFQSRALANAGVFSRATKYNQWITLNMNPASLFAVNRIGRTQFRVRFTLDDSNNIIKHQLGFLSGDYSIVADRPLLIVTYYVP